MLLDLMEHLNYSTPLRDNVNGVIVENNDPKGLGRVKIKLPTLYETDNHDNLPWVYPKRPVEGGGRSDLGHGGKPEINTAVMCSFPTGNIYHCQYDGVTSTPQSAQSLFNSNPVPQAPDSELHIPNGSGKTDSGGKDDDAGYGDVSGSGVNASESNSSNMLGSIWPQLASAGQKALSWFRMDKNQGVMEWFNGSSKGSNGSEYGSLFRMDRSGNLQMHVPGNFDMVVKGSHTHQVDGDHQSSIGGNTYHNSTGNATHRVGGHLTETVAGDHDNATKGNSGHSVDGQHGRNAKTIMDNSGYKPGTQPTQDSAHTDKLAALKTRTDYLGTKLAALHQQHDDMLNAGSQEQTRLAQLASSYSGETI